MGLDKLHKQNKAINGICAAANVLIRTNKAALNRWALSVPDLAQMINEFEGVVRGLVGNHQSAL